MNLQNRIDCLAAVGHELIHNREKWADAIHQASLENPWFLPTFIHRALDAIAHDYLQAEKLVHWTKPYTLPEPVRPLHVGVIMAGNIPLVGIHDLISVFIAGHTQHIRLSSKDSVLMRFFVEQLIDQNPSYAPCFVYKEQLTQCDAYICTGSSQSAGVFASYFGKYPNIIRGAKTSVAILDGHETAESLNALADDVLLYFGLGCRNVTKIYVPNDYSFDHILQAFSKYDFLMQHHRYKNNYDYQLSIALLNQVPILTNEALLLLPSSSLFSAIGVVHYEPYSNRDGLLKTINQSNDIQCIVGNGFMPFGKAQHPQLWDYADGTDTLAFLCQLTEKSAS